VVQRTPDFRPRVLLSGSFPNLSRLISGAALIAASCVGCRSHHQVAFDWPDRVVDAGGWSYIRLPQLERSIWFCTDSNECTWQRLGQLAGLEPIEYQWWVKDITGGPVFDAKPALGKRYTVPNRVYLVMGDASIYNPVAYVPYLGYAFQWIIDYPESMWSHLTRPIGAAYVLRPSAPAAQGYNVTVVNNASRQDLGEIVKGADTFALVYFGHGNKLGLSSKQTVHAGFVHIMSARNVQHHLMGKVVLNSCLGYDVAEKMTSTTGAVKGHEGYVLPPFGALFW